MHRTTTDALLTPAPFTLTRLFAPAVACAAALLLVAGPALAHTGDDSHTHDDTDVDYADPIIWDGASTVDCSATGEGTILWTLTGSDDVTYAELHIDQPTRSITTRNAAPYLWVSPLYPLDTIDADIDRITGELAADAALVVVHCPEGGTTDLAASVDQTTADVAGAADPVDPAGLALPIGGSLVVGALLGLLVGSRRRTTSPAA